MSIFDKESFKMKNKRGVIPKRVWNRFVDVCFANFITSIEGGKMRKGEGFGVSLVIDPSTGGGGGGGAGVCVLGDELDDPLNAGKKKLRDGYLTGGGGSEPVQANNLTPTIGNHIYLVVTWTAQEIDDVLQSGGILGTVTPTVGATIPDDTVPTISSLSGIAHIPLGQWVSDGATPTPGPVWQKAGCGNVGLYFCPAQGFIYSRI